MTESNTGEDVVDVAALLAALAAAEQHAVETAGGRGLEYQAGVADGFAAAQDLIREQAGWPVETAPVIDEP